jgi:hypothetical protein
MKSCVLAPHAADHGSLLHDLYTTSNLMRQLHKILDNKASCNKTTPAMQVCAKSSWAHVGCACGCAE